MSRRLTQIAANIGCSTQFQARYSVVVVNTIGTPHRSHTVVWSAIPLSQLEKRMDLEGCRKTCCLEVAQNRSISGASASVIQRGALRRSSDNVRGFERPDCDLSVI
jgi:hypothetical protein